VGDLLHGFGRGEGTQKTDQDLAFAHQIEIASTGLVIGAVAKHLHHNVRLGKNRIPVGKDLSALLLVLRIEIPGFFARTGFHHDFQAGLGKHGNHNRRQSNAPLPWIDFLRNANDHEV